MKEKHKLELHDILTEHIGRDPSPNEKINAETDVGLLAKFLLQKVQELETRVELLEKNKQ